MVRRVDVSSDNQASRTALEYYRALRKEIVARLQMRDRVLLAYLGAIGVLLGLGSSHEAGSEQLRRSLLVLLPFLSFGASTMVTHHSDQITAYYQYFCTELRPSLSPPEREVTMFYLSKVCPQSRSVRGAAPLPSRPMYAMANMGHPSREAGLVLYSRPGAAQ
jgi:hypothetical protein